MTVVANISSRKAAIVAGFGLMAMTIFAVAAIFIIFPKLIIPGEATVTVNNLMINESLFRIGIACLIIIAILDVLVAWALYVYFEPVNRSISVLAAWFRLVYTAILCFAMSNYLDVLHLISGATNLNVIGEELLRSNIMHSMSAFEMDWGLGLAFFGIHLILIGYLILRASSIPKLLGIILIAAGSAYLIDNLGMIVLKIYDFAIADFFGWGELLLMFWLLFRGGKENAYNHPA